MRTKEQHNKYNSEWAKKNRDKTRRYMQNWYNERKVWFNEIKSKLSCDCGEKDTRCLDFHHLVQSEKISEVGKMLTQRVNKKIILAEIKKCKILCSNCHRKYHSNKIVPVSNFG